MVVKLWNRWFTGIIGSLKSTEPNLRMWRVKRGSGKRPPFHYFKRLAVIKTKVDLSQLMFSFRKCLSTNDYEKATEFNICVYDSVTMFRFNPLKIKGKFASTFVPLVWVLLSKGRLFSHPRPLCFIVMKMWYLHNISSVNHAFPTFLGKCIVVKCKSFSWSWTQLDMLRAVNRTGIKHRLQ